jgi:hypothetical protein
VALVPLRPLWFKTQQQPAADELDKIQSDVTTHLIFWFVAVISSINKPLRRFFFLATREPVKSRYWLLAISIFYKSYYLLEYTYLIRLFT